MCWLITHPKKKLETNNLNLSARVVGVEYGFMTVFWRDWLKFKECQKVKPDAKNVECLLITKKKDFFENAEFIKLCNQLYWK